MKRALSVVLAVLMINYSAMIVLSENVDDFNAVDGQSISESTNLTEEKQKADADDEAKTNAELGADASNESYNANGGTVAAIKGMSNFKAVNDAPSFSDVEKGYWGEAGIIKTYQYGLMTSVGTDMFLPRKKVTLADAMTLAYRIYDIYNGGTGVLPVSNDVIWWDQIYDLSKKAGLLEGVGGFEDIETLDSVNVLRIQMAELFVNALPADEFTPINPFQYAPTDITSEASMMLYTSGIMQGDTGGMREYSNITRDEIAAIVNRLVADRKKWEPIDYTYIIIESFADAAEEQTESDEPDYSVCFGRYETYYKANDVNKSTNVELAVKNINGTILQPGEEFSFNRVVGPRTIATGFRVARVIENGEYVDGVGGGICQVSSTLFNVVLQTNLSITERHFHTIHSTYVPMGYDATVAWGALDFKFANSGTKPIMVAGYAYNGTIVMSIWGAPEDYVPGVTTSVTHYGLRYTLKRWVEGVGETYSTTSNYSK